MIDRASGYVDPDEEFQLEEGEDQDTNEEESKMIHMLFKVVNHKQKNQQDPSWSGR